MWWGFAVVPPATARRSCDSPGVEVAFEAASGGEQSDLAPPLVRNAPQKDARHGGRKDASSWAASRVACWLEGSVVSQCAVLVEVTPGIGIGSGVRIDTRNGVVECRLRWQRAVVLLTLRPAQSTVRAHPLTLVAVPEAAV